MRVTTKEVKHEVNGQEMTFQIRKMDALHGSYLMKFCAEKFLPVMNDVQGLFNEELPEDKEKADRIMKMKTDKVFQLIPKALSALSEDELINFEIRCLQTVDVLKPAGWVCVMDGKHFGIEELEEDIKTMLILCYEVVEFNMGSFFGGNSLSSLLHRQNT